MPGSSAKRIVGTLLFTVALLVTLGFVFILFAESRNLRDVPGAEQVQPVSVVVLVTLAVIAVLLLLLLILSRVEARQRRAAEAEAYYVPEEDRKAMEEEKRSIFDRAFMDSEGPVAMPPDVKVYYLPAVPVMERAWGGAERDGPYAVHPFFFPRSVEHGVYVNDYIDVDRKGHRVKLRTLLAGTEDWPEDAPEEPAPPVRKEEEPLEEKPAAAANGAEAQEKEEEDGDHPRPGRPPRPEARSGEGRGRVGGRTDELPGDSFMRELEERSKSQEAAAVAVEETDTVHYDYPGDVHPVEDIEGVGPEYLRRLQGAGVRTTSRLCYEDPVELSLQIDVPTRTVRQWQHQAELMKVSGIGPQFAEAMARAGIEGIQDLKKRSAQAIADQVRAYLDSLDRPVLGTTITEGRVRRWQEKAQQMRRVRMKVPAQ